MHTQLLYERELLLLCYVIMMHPAKCVLLVVFALLASLSQDPAQLLVQLVNFRAALQHSAPAL